MKIEDAIRQGKAFKDAYQKLYINLIYTSNSLSNQFDKAFKKHGLTSQQFNILRILKGAHPEVKCAGDIKLVMLDKNPDVTRLVDRLVQKGLVFRNTCPNSRRKVDIGITQEGLDLIDSIGPDLEKEYQVFQNNLTEQEADLLSDLLDKLRG
ncbi:MarR family transcriptional regulator [Rapidithrix thailandica]|uniref:MarR family transcriptional regulator n=1 Tax=Rapidithrix thailandica TaxID=413964 RepID=A0AAW9S7F5_9BACT